jgi:hypothetical protein
MGQRMDQIVARVEDPANPVVWLDPSTSAELWAGLPSALSARAFEVVVLTGVWDRVSLREQILRLLQATGALQEALSALPLRERQQGWVIVFEQPDALREYDEAAFEELLETVSQVHETHWNSRRSHLKLVVRD